MCSSSMHSVPGYPDSAFERARAYIAGPVAPEDGLMPALKWAFQHHPEARWERIAILVPGQEHEWRHRGLHRLRARGVTVEAATAPRPLAGFTGPVIACCPDLHALAVAEQLPITCGIVAVAADNAPLRPWVHAFTPQHLAGQVLPPAQPLLPDATVRRAMVYFTHRLTTTSLADDHSRIQGIVEGLRHLRAQGGVFTTEELIGLALQLNWPAGAVDRLQQLATEAFPEPAA